MKHLYRIIISGIAYCLFTFLLSFIIKLPPYNDGLIVGYPAIYYKFKVSPTESQFGFTGLTNILINILIILLVYFIYMRLSKKRN